MFINTKGWLSKNENIITSTSPIWLYLIILVDIRLFFITMVIIAIQVINIHIRK